MKRNEELLAKAKEDIKILMKDNRFSNFVKGNSYRWLIKGDLFYLIDEDRKGFCCTEEEFCTYFDV